MLVSISAFCFWSMVRPSSAGAAPGVPVVGSEPGASGAVEPPGGGFEVDAALRSVVSVVGAPLHASIPGAEPRATMSAVIERDERQRRERD